MKKSILVTCALMSLNIFAAEVDSFTVRYVPIDDALEIVNQKSNDMLETALIDLNQKDHKCSEKKLYKRLRKVFNNQYRGDFTKWIVTTEEIDKRLVGIEESVYSTWSWKEAIIMGGYSRMVDPSAATLNMNGHYIGTDKFEHFLGSGYRYFNKHYLKNENMNEAVGIGLKAETGLLGAMTTGVQSYGDLTANFNGMRFWNHLLQKHDDVLGADYNIGPFLKCEGGKWSQVKSIDWSNYIDSAFDETINCSKFRTQSMIDKVNKRIKRLEDRDHLPYACPVFSKNQDSLTQKYGKYAPILLNFEGFKVADKKWRLLLDLILN